MAINRDDLARMIAGLDKEVEERRLARENHDATVSRLGDLLLALDAIYRSDDNRTCRELADICSDLVLMNSQLLDRVAKLEGVL